MTAPPPDATPPATPILVYGASDVAKLFGVEKATVSNWCKRFPDQVPPPDVVSTCGRKYWLSLDGWQQWRAPRSTQIERQIAKLQAQLDALKGGTK